MELLRNRGTAVLVCVIMIVCSVFLGARLSLMSLRGQAEAAFGRGSEDVAVILSESGNVAELADRYLAGDGRIAELRQKQDVLAAAQAPAEQYVAAQDLRLRALELAGLLEAQDMEEMYTGWLAGYRENIEGSYARLTRAYGEYGEAAAEFNGALRAFPANLLGGLTGVRSLEHIA